MKNPRVDKPKRIKKITTKKLDDLFSDYIRMTAIERVGGCERCLRTKHDTTRQDGSTRPAYMELDCAHFDGRGNFAVRWDEDNAAGLCGGCHRYLDAHPIEKIAWFKEHLGDFEFDCLEVRMRMSGKPDRQAIKLYLTEQLRGFKQE